jgi:hypothetical protein
LVSFYGCGDHARFFDQGASMSDQTVNIELFKVASTLFLGIGLAAAFQQLLPFDHAEASRRGKLRWAFWDDFVAALMLVLIAAGEVMSIRVITADEPELQARLASDAHPWVVRLLIVTALYIVLKFFASRVLQVTWHRERRDAKARCTYKESVRMLGAAFSGLGLGGMLLAHFAEPTPNLIFVSPYRSLWLLWLIAVGFLLAGLLALGRSHFMRDPSIDDARTASSRWARKRGRDMAPRKAPVIHASGRGSRRARTASATQYPTGRADRGQPSRTRRRAQPSRTARRQK